MATTKILIFSALLLSMSMLAIAPSAEARDAPGSVEETCNFVLSQVGGWCQLNREPCDRVVGKERVCDRYA